MKSEIQNALEVAIKIFYILPAVLWDVIWLFILMIAGWKDASPIAWLYPVLPTAAAVLLCKGKWWGCLPGMAMGAMLLFLVPNEETSGLRYCIYFALMGILCYLTNRKKEEKQ